MAKNGIQFEDLEKFSERLIALGNSKAAEAIIKQTLYEGAGVYADAVRSELSHVIEGNSYFRVFDHSLDKRERTGALLSSLSLTPMRDDNGWSTRLTFLGVDGKGTPNAIKAAALEYGTSKQAKTPFLRPAIKKVQAEANAKMNAKMNELIENAMEE